MRTTGIGHSNKNHVKRVRSGIPSLDLLVHGGFPIGSLIIIEEDVRNTNWLNIAKCFLGEGNITDDNIFIYSDELDVNLIPGARRMGNEEQHASNIQWRYDSFLPGSRISEPYCIDINRRSEDQEGVVYGLIDTTLEECYKHLWNSIRTDVMIKHNLRPNHLNRIFIQSMMKETWPKSSYSNIFQFLNSLKTLLRSINGVCLITIPMQNIKQDLQALIYNTSDAIFACETAESKRSSMLRIKKPLRNTNFDFKSRVLIIRLEKSTIGIEEIITIKEA